MVIKLIGRLFKATKNGKVPLNQTPGSVIPPLPYFFEHTTPGNHREWRSRAKLEIAAL